MRVPGESGKGSKRERLRGVETILKIVSVTHGWGVVSVGISVLCHPRRGLTATRLMPLGDYTLHRLNILPLNHCFITRICTPGV